jgi:CRP-like cAMP-binding protein
MDIVNKRKQVMDVLRRSEIFSVLDEDELYKLSLLTNELEVAKDEYVFSERQEGKTLYIVASGDLLLELVGKPFKTFSTGDNFGEVALVNDQIRTGSIKAINDSTLICIKGKDLFDIHKLDCYTILKIYRGIAKQVTTYLRTDKHTTTHLLIQKGESENVELKSSLRWNYHSGKYDKEIEHAALKTIAAFLNTNGGTLIIGVNDDGEIIGIENDGFASDDKAMLHVTNLVRERLDPIHLNSIHIEVEILSGRKVLRVDVDPAKNPAYVKHKNDEKFYIRSGPATSALKVSHVFDYIRSRFAECMNNDEIKDD